MKKHTYNKKPVVVDEQYPIQKTYPHAHHVKQELDFMMQGPEMTEDLIGATQAMSLVVHTKEKKKMKVSKYWLKPPQYSNDI